MQRELRKQRLTKIRPTNGLLSSTELKAETEGLIIAEQDQSLAPRSCNARIIKGDTDPVCRIYNKYYETRDHIVSCCPELAKTEYIQTQQGSGIYFGKHISTTTSLYRTSDMSMNQVRSLKITKNLTYFGICKYTQIEK